MVVCSVESVDQKWILKTCAAGKMHWLQLMHGDQESETTAIVAFDGTQAWVGT